MAKIVVSGAMNRAPDPTPHRYSDGLAACDALGLSGGTNAY